MELQSITLNVPFDLPDEDWNKIMAVYREMDGWIEGKDFYLNGSRNYLSSIPLDLALAGAAHAGHEGA